ncbi:MAG: YusW family protein [Bacillus sp. (in: firmicutes)]
MKKWTGLCLTAAASIMILGGCGDADDDNVNMNQGNQTEQGTNTETSDGKQTTEHNISFSSFELDVDYNNNKSFEVDYENDNEGTEASIDDELNNRKIKGDEAFQELKNRLESFSFDQNTPEDEVIQEVLNSFDLKNDYKHFELEVTFSDGTVKEYRK